MNTNEKTVRHKSRKASIYSGDWFGCGKVITTESWNAFLAARKAYYQKKENHDHPAN